VSQQLTFFEEKYSVGLVIHKSGFQLSIPIYSPYAHSLNHYYILYVNSCYPYGRNLYILGINPENKSLWIFLENPDFIIPIDSQYWKSLVEEAIKQHMKDGKPPTQPVVIRIPNKGSPAIIKNGLQPAIELNFKPKSKKKGLLDRLQGR